jgi:hypothetical protein
MSLNKNTIIEWQAKCPKCLTVVATHKEQGVEYWRDILEKNLSWPNFLTSNTILGRCLSCGEFVYSFDKLPPHRILGNKTNTAPIFKEHPTPIEQENDFLKQLQEFAEQMGDEHG